MKKIASILFIIIASIFCFKDIFVLVASDSFSFVMDINEEDDESDKTEKGDLDEKGDVKEFQINNLENLMVVDIVITSSFRHYKEKKHYTPFFEICSPPPELI